jgi:hypothetical protein
MKIHEFADALMVVAKLLKTSPNMEMSEWSGKVETPSSTINSADVALSLSTVAALSKIKKNEWRAFIDDWALPVLVKNTDSARDLIGRLLRYLGEHPDALRKLHTDSAKKSKKSSPELMKALAILLGRPDEPEKTEEDKK